MSRPKQATISRTYMPAPEACARAVELLLKQLAIKEGGGSAALDDAKVRSKHDSRATSSIPE